MAAFKIPSRSAAASLRSWYGQFNNQILALINALSIARDIGAVLVLPCEKLGKESIRDSREIKMRRLFSMRQLVDSYFNYSLLQSVVPVVNPSEFFNSSDGVELLARQFITTERKSGGFYRYLFSGRPRGYDPGEVGIRIRNPDSYRPKLKNWCDFRASKALTFRQKFMRSADRYVFLPAVFRHHDLNCTQFDPLWLSVRRYLKPRDEFLDAVDRFMRTELPQPTLAIHMRFFLNGDIDNFTPESFVDMLRRDYGAELAQSRSVFLAYTPSNNESAQILSLLQRTLPDTRVVGGTTIPALLPEAFRQLPLHSVLLDMWVCVKSTRFLGRVGSSLSWNVVYWSSPTLAPQDWRVEYNHRTAISKCENKHYTQQQRRIIAAEILAEMLHGSI